MMRRVSLGYLRNDGVYFALQDNIGDLLISGESTISFRHFCELLSDGGHLIWFSRLIDYYLATAKGEHLARVDEALTAREELLTFFDHASNTQSTLGALVAAEVGGRR
jgi:hypothetical protein